MATEQEGHTPGPWGQAIPNTWFVENDDAGYVSWSAIAAETGVVALIVSEEPGDKFFEANARLIAAAPDLLKAGESARQALWNALDHLGFECPDEHPAIVELDAAIARATGEA